MHKKTGGGEQNTGSQGQFHARFGKYAGKNRDNLDVENKHGNYYGYHHKKRIPHCTFKPFFGFQFHGKVIGKLEEYLFQPPHVLPYLDQCHKQGIEHHGMRTHGTGKGTPGTEFLRQIVQGGTQLGATGRHG